METSLPHSNLNGHRAQAPHSDSIDSKDLLQSKPTHLSKNGVWNLQDVPNQKLQTKQSLVLQVVYCKVFPLEDKQEDSTKKKPKLQIKAKYSLSDGISSVKALVPENNYKKIVNAPKLHDVIMIENFQKTIINDQTLLMLKDPIHVLYDNISEKIGEPKDLKEIIDAKETFETNSEAVEIPQPSKVVEKAASPVKAVQEESKKPSSPVVKQAPKKVEASEVKPASFDLNSNNYMPIKALNTFSRDWCIKARVANKVFKPTQKGGQLLKVELVDQYGTQIEGTFFNDGAKKFDPILQQNKVYVFSNGQVKMANKRFTSIRNDFSIIFETRSDIQEAKDDGSISNQAFDFCRITDIQEIMQQKTIDVVGVISEMGEKDSINLKSGQSKMRKHVQIVDDSEKSISITLWGEDMCDQCNLQVGDVMALKSARCSEYQGKSLNAGADHAQLFKQNEISHHSQAKKVIAWYTKVQAQNGGNCQEFFSNFDSLTVKQQRDGGNFKKGELNKQKESNLNLICEINQTLQDTNDVDQSHFFFLNGYLSRIKNDDRIYYPACKGEKCMKKVTEEQQGYRCETCDKTYPDFNPTYMFSAQISDFSESIYVNFARDQGTSLMGMTAEAFKKFKEENDEATVQKHFDDLLFKSFNIMVRGKYEYFNGENRVRYFATKVFPHSIVSENKALLSRLDMYSKKGSPGGDENMTIGGGDGFMM